MNSSAETFRYGLNPGKRAERTTQPPREQQSCSANCRRHTPQSLPDRPRTDRATTQPLTDLEAAIDAIIRELGFSVQRTGPKDD